MIMGKGQWLPEIVTVRWVREEPGVSTSSIRTGVIGCFSSCPVRYRVFRPVFLLLAGTIPIGFVFTSIAVLCRFGRDADTEPSVRQKLVDWSTYALGGAAVLCLVCFLSIRNGRSPAIVFGGLGLAFLPISAGLALCGRGAGKIAILHPSRPVFMRLRSALWRFAGL